MRKLTNRQRLGSEAEAAAERYLQTQGLTLLQKNYRCYFGEIDLIMQDKETIVFVEVRSRQRLDYGSALESVTDSKQRKLFKTAMHFLQMKQWLHKITSRFDVIAIQHSEGKMQLEWVKHAFERRAYT